MHHTSHNWKSSNGTTLSGHSWTPEGKSIKSIICIVHGFNEHCLRYVPYLEYFVKQGNAVVSYDQISHGNSEGKKGAITSFDHLVDDVEICIDKAKELFPTIPVVLYGHSMGGNVCLNLLLRKEIEISGAVISSPWLTLTNKPNQILIAVVSFLAKILPNVSVDSNIDPKELTHVQERIDTYKNDPKSHGKISFRTFSQITKAGLWAKENSPKLKTKTLLLHGTEDRVTSFNSSQEIASKNTEYIYFEPWEGMYHEIHNEDCRDELSVQVMNWIDNCLN